MRGDHAADISMGTGYARRRYDGKAYVFTA
jgi:hypothetical protein